MNRKSFKKRIKKVKSEKCGKMIALYSELEEKFMLQLESDPSVISYQKNVPISKFGSKNESKYCPDDFTSDFLINYSDGFTTVREIVDRKKLEKPAMIELLELSRRCWSAKEIDWGIITEKE